MKKLAVLVICCLALFLTSCQFSETIYLNEDGSGKMAFSFDASELIQMTGDQFLEGDGEKDVDSTFTFKAVFDEKRDSNNKKELSQIKEDSLLNSAMYLENKIIRGKMMSCQTILNLNKTQSKT